MKALIQRDQKRRKKFKKKEQRRKFLKSIIINFENSQLDRWSAQTALSEIPYNSNSNRIRNRCLNTARSKAISGIFKIGRHSLRSFFFKWLCSRRNEKFVVKK